jgi:hypothetical protein
MALHRFGFIVTGQGLDPSVHRVEMKAPTFTMIAVGVARASEAPAVARALVADGVQLIELCGGFGPGGTSRVIEAIEGAVPVGAVGYGPESVDALHALFSAA